jgi:hypothetical protein
VAVFAAAVEPLPDVVLEFFPSSALRTAYRQRQVELEDVDPRLGLV